MARYEPEPGGQIACPSESPAIADRRKQSRGVQRADPGNGDQAAGSLIGARALHHFVVQVCESAIELGPLRPHVLDERHHP
jgi:hypothetical protein